MKCSRTGERKREGKGTGGGREERGGGEGSNTRTQ